MKERFGYFYDHQLDIISGINADAEYLKYAVKEDDNKWDTYAAYTSSTISVWQAYGTKVGAMKVWLSSRMNWLKREFDAMAWQPVLNLLTSTDKDEKVIFPHTIDALFVFL